MTDPQYRVHLAIASPSEIERTARQLRTMREGFLSTGSLGSTPRPLILQSWQRCHAMHVNSSQRCAPLAITWDSQLHLLREVNELLIRATRSVMNYLTDFLADSGYVVVLSDAKGCLLDVIGDVGIRRQLARIDFVPGGNWSEAAAGTNAIGTALADGHVVQLMAAEHYCDGWTDLTCTASPIRHPLTHEIIGILDVTGNYRLIRPFLTSFLAAAAFQVQQELRTCLTTPYAGERQVVLQGGGRANGSSGMSLFKINMNSMPWHSNGKEVLEIPTVDDMRLQLDLQARRALDAEHLAAAAGAVSASLDLYVALKNVAEQLAYLLRLESAAVCLFNEKDESLSLQMWCNKQNALCSESVHNLEALLEGTEAISLIRERGEPVIFDDVLTTTLLPATLIEQTGIRALALLPLMTARGVIGFVAAPKYSCYHWHIDDVRLGLAFATQSATAIENALLFETLQQHNRHIEALNTIAQLLSTLPDPSQSLNLVLERVAEIMDLDAGMVLLLDKNEEHLTLVAQYGQPEAILSDLGELPLKPLYEVADQVSLTGEPFLINGLKSDGRIMGESLQAMDLCDLMVVPLAATSDILGVLLVGSHSPRGLTEEDLGLFTTIGQQLGLALKNAQLVRAESEMEILREADRLKSGFLAAVSHDLRSPLTAIRASVEGLLDPGRSQSAHSQERLLNNIASQASRLGRLVDQLLDLSRIEAGALSLDRDWTELPALLADTITKFEELSNGCKVELDLAADLPLQYIDPDCLIQVLWNLLENAYKYAPAGSPIKVEARRTGKEVLIRVADRGPGIPASERETIFQRFYRLDRGHRADMRGCGLGLAICRGIVEAHDGRIWVEDRPDGGSIFCFTLPLPTSTPIVLEALEEQAFYNMSVKER